MAKLGLCALLLSVNNSVAAVAHLCKQTKSSHLIYGTKYEQTAKEAQELLKAEGVTIEVLPETRYPLWGPGGVRDAKIPAYPARLTPEQEAKRACVLVSPLGILGFQVGNDANCIAPLVWIHRVPETSLHHPLWTYRQYGNLTAQDWIQCSTTLPRLRSFLDVSPDTLNP